MPIYEYICPGCQLEEEVLVRGSAAGDGRICKICGRPMERKVSLPGTVIFTGTGYYTTDYKRKEGGPNGSSKPATDRTTDGAPSTQTDKSTDKSADKSANKNTDKGTDKGARTSPTPSTPAATPPASGSKPAASGEKKRA